MKARSPSFRKKWPPVMVSCLQDPVVTCAQPNMSSGGHEWIVCTRKGDDGAVERSVGPVGVALVQCNVGSKQRQVTGGNIGVREYGLRRAANAAQGLEKAGII